MKKILLLLFLCLITMPVLASNYIEIGYKRYIDTDTIKYTGNTVSYWEKTLNYKDGKKQRLDDYNGKYVYYDLSNIQINCRERTYKYVYMILYDVNENFIDSYKFITDYYGDTGFNPIAPGTVIEGTYKLLCNRK